ncbi:hypothetical protein B7463_g11184, partial [Scytalidium lignicola]
MALEKEHEVEEPLISDHNLEAASSEWFRNAASESKSRKAVKFQRRLLFFLLTVLPWNLLALIILWNFMHYVRCPVQHLLEYELRYFGTGHKGDPSPYFGEASPELDKAWEDLYPSLYQLIPKQQAAKLANKTLIFPHDPQRRYVIELDVFHQLHCLNMIRQSTHPEYYKGAVPGVIDGNKEDLLFGPHHVAHCIESIRQALMCHVDVTPATWIWNEDAKVMQNVYATPHTCRNFDKIRDWASVGKYGANVEAGFDFEYREMNDPLDPKTVKKPDFALHVEFNPALCASAIGVGSKRSTARTACDVIARPRAADLEQRLG